MTVSPSTFLKEKHMTYLMVNLNDHADCREAIQRLRDAIRDCGPGKRRRHRSEAAGLPRTEELPRTDGALGDEKHHDLAGEDRPPRRSRRQRPAANQPTEQGTIGAVDVAPSPVDRLHDLPLPKKLHRIAQRGVFLHLIRIAGEVDSPMSLPELDKQLGFQPNKMRSLKAIMAKLENRFGIRFLVADPEGGIDENGNPRYVMLPRMRKQIMRVAEAA